MFDGEFRFIAVLNFCRIFMCISVCVLNIVCIMWRHVFLKVFLKVENYVYFSDGILRHWLSNAGHHNRNLSPLCHHTNATQPLHLHSPTPCKDLTGMCRFKSTQYNHTHAHTLPNLKPQFFHVVYYSVLQMFTIPLSLALLARLIQVRLVFFLRKVGEKSE